MEPRGSRERLNTLRRILKSAGSKDCWVKIPEQCLNPVINAHSVQEAVLHRIANPQGNVITVMPRSFGAATNPNREKLTEIHSANASIGTWSCKKHDEFFQRELENEEPTWHVPRPNLVLTLRAFLYRNWLDLFELELCTARGDVFPWETHLLKEAEFVERRQRKYQSIVDLLNELVDNEEYDYLCYRTRAVEGVPTVACSTVALLQLRGSPDKEESFISVTVYPTERGHVVSVAYPEEDKDYVEASFHAFSFRNDIDFEEAISEFILINPYNTFISPISWQVFGPKQRETIHQQIRAHEKVREIPRLIVPPPSAISMFNLFRVLN